MNEKHIDTIAEANKALLEISSLAHNNPAIKMPRHSDEYINLADSLLDILRSGKVI